MSGGFKTFLNPYSPLITTKIPGYESTHYSTKIGLSHDQLKSVFIDSVSFPNTIYNIDEHNNFFYIYFPKSCACERPGGILFQFEDSGTLQLTKVTIPMGYYNLDNLVTTINTALSLLYVDVNFVDWTSAPSTCRLHVGNRFNIIKEFDSLGNVATTTTTIEDSIACRLDHVGKTPTTRPALTVLGIPAYEMTVPFDIVYENKPTLYGWSAFHEKTVAMGSFYYYSSLPYVPNESYSLLLDQMGFTSNLETKAWDAIGIDIAPHTYNIGIHNVFLHSSALSGLENVVRNVPSNVMLSIPLTRGYGYQIYYEPNMIKKLRFSSNTIHDIDIGLYDEYGYPINLHGGDLNVSLIFSTQDGSPSY
jgi:hypothetical protein